MIIFNGKPDFPEYDGSVAILIIGIVYVVALLAMLGFVIYMIASSP